ncbi:MAG: S49 family peptidase [Pseudomonadota bacterium]
MPVVRLSGAIGDFGRFSRGLSLSSIAGSLEKAFSLKKAPAVALSINSPGGSPVQSALIAQRIRNLAAEKDKKVLGFVEDVGGSGGYWLACAADEIFVDASSIVGSIGVIYSGFGFKEAIEKLGIERRLYTAGERKSLLDAFQDQKPEDVEKLRSVQGRIHEEFKAYVRERRDGRLKVDEADIFNGSFWTGREALELGIVDGIGHLRPVLKERFGENVRLRAVTPSRGLFRRSLRFEGRDAGPFSFVQDMPAAALSAIEERLLWQRFGL